MLRRWKRRMLLNHDEPFVWRTTMFSPSPPSDGGEGWGEEVCVMNRTTNARRLRRDQTEEEKQLWRALRAGRFAGFKFRRQHPVGIYYLDFFCPAAKLSIELDGFGHGLPAQRRRDDEREKFLAVNGIDELRFWNREWRKNREGVLLEIWSALNKRTGRVAIMRKVQNHRFIPPKPEQLIRSERKTSSPRPSPPSDGGEGEERRAALRLQDQ